MKLAVIISYYNNPDLLALCLESLALQTRMPNEIIIADDASDIPPSPVWAFNLRLPEPTAWIRKNVHNGFGKEGIFNRALIQTDADFIIAVDSDCIFPPDFVSLYEQHAKPREAICGQYTSLDEYKSKLVSPETIRDGSIWKTIPDRYEGEPMVWVGTGSGVWRKDALKINGFDTRLGWCGTDYNFGMRLANSGVRLVHSSSYARYFHLHHEKPWANGVDKKAENKLAVKYAVEGTRAKRGIAELNLLDFTIVQRQEPMVGGAADA